MGKRVHIGGKEGVLLSSRRGGLQGDGSEQAVKSPRPGWPSPFSSQAVLPCSFEEQLSHERGPGEVVRPLVERRVRGKGGANARLDTRPRPRSVGNRDPVWPGGTCLAKDVTGQTSAAGGGVGSGDTLTWRAAGWLPRGHVLTLS